MLFATTIIGRHHRLKQQNCHDFATTYRCANGHKIGLVLDGCGSKFTDQSGIYYSQNEIGAKLLGKFATRFLAQQLAQHTDIQVAIEHLYKATLSFLSRLLDLYEMKQQAEIKRFLYTHFLCTMLGFVMIGDTAVFFWRGDGWLIYNDTMHELKANNQPDYLAYDLLSEAKGVPTKTVKSSKHKQIGVATDGWSNTLLTELVPQKNEILLQRWMNVHAQQTAHFEDDASIAIYWNDEP